MYQTKLDLIGCTVLCRLKLSFKIHVQHLHNMEMNFSTNDNHLYDRHDTASVHWSLHQNMSVNEKFRTVRTQNWFNWTQKVPPSAPTAATAKYINGQQGQLAQLGCCSAAAEQGWAGQPRLCLPVLHHSSSSSSSSRLLASRRTTSPTPLRCRIQRYIGRPGLYRVWRCWLMGWQPLSSNELTLTALSHFNSLAAYAMAMAKTCRYFSYSVSVIFSKNCYSSWVALFSAS